MNYTLFAAKVIANRTAKNIKLNARNAQKAVVNNKSELTRVAIASAVVYLVARRNGFVAGYNFAANGSSLPTQ